MKRIFLRCIFALCLLCCSTAGRAEWRQVISQNFNSLQANAVIEGWVLQCCSRIYNIANETYALKMGTVNDAGSATTPVIGVAGDLTLTFTYANASASSYATLTVSLIGGGSITEAASFTPSSHTEYLPATLHITGATSATQIRFSSDGGGIALDDVVVEGNVLAPAAPSFSLAEGHYKTAQTLTMTCTTEDAEIRYTLDGENPTVESALYVEPITISESVTVKAKAFKGDLVSGVTTARYYVGDYIYANAFTNETNGYNDMSSSFSVANLDVGRSAILSFRVYGRTANSSLILNVRENYQQNHSQASRLIIKDEVLSAAQNVWETRTYAIPVLHDDATITVIFSSGTNVGLDDVVLVKPAVITLDENGDNGGTLTDHAGRIVDVETRRTLRAGIWNTLCLPFDVTLDVLNRAFGEAQDVTMTRYSSYADDVMTFSSVDNNAMISAGVPFLLKINKNVVNPTFRAVTIGTAEPQIVTFGDVTFQGVFGRTVLNTDGSDLFIGTDNCLYQPAAGTNVMGGLRAYIQRTNNARISLAVDDETVAVEGVGPNVTRPVVVYTLQGQRTTAARRGVYVAGGKKMVVVKK